MTIPLMDMERRWLWRCLLACLAGLLPGVSGFPTSLACLLPGVSRLLPSLPSLLPSIPGLFPTHAIAIAEAWFSLHLGN